MGWLEGNTKVDIIVNGQVIEESISVNGSAWCNPGRKAFGIPNNLLDSSGNNTFSVI